MSSTRVGSTPTAGGRSQKMSLKVTTSRKLNSSDHKFAKSLLASGMVPSSKLQRVFSVLEGAGADEENTTKIPRIMPPHLRPVASYRLLSVKFH